MSLKPLRLPASYNYIACFLTLGCNLKCNYCINNFRSRGKPKRKLISGKEWVAALNRLDCPADLPVTLQGGEPSLHPDFIWIITHLRKDLNIDILTNLSFEAKLLIDNVNPARLKRSAPYPNIRVSYHPQYMDLDRLIAKTLKLQQAGFSIGIFSVLYPPLLEKIFQAQKKCLAVGIDFRTKEFLGEYQHKIYGTYRYPQAVGSTKLYYCFCKTSELIVGSDGSVFRCHHDFYKGFPAVGSLLDPAFKIKAAFRECASFGDCNPCDVKVKTDRFQIFGHASVKIRGIKK